MVNLLLTAHLELAQERARNLAERVHVLRHPREPVTAPDPMRRHAARRSPPVLVA
jgi:hypothetical protein